jgi:hypothetical protein
MAFNGTGSNVTSLNANNIASGTVPTARLGSGTANSSTFLRGDQTYASVAGAPNPLHGKQVFTSSGTFNVPTGVTTVLVTVIGAAGNGGVRAAAPCGGFYTGGGGGAGGYVVDYVAVTAGGTASVTVGVNSGTRTSSFAGGTTLTASGGGNGSNSNGLAGGNIGASGAGSKFGLTVYSGSIGRQGGYTGLDGFYTSGDFSGGMVYLVHSLGIGGTSFDSGRINGLGFGAGGAGSVLNTTVGVGTNGVVIVEW